MTPAARIQSTIDLLDLIFNQKEQPADAVVASFFRARRFIGSSDRRDITERTYRILRTYESLIWRIKTAKGEPTPRLLVMADIIHTTPDTALHTFFDGNRHSPEALTSEEQRTSDFLKSLDESLMPDAARHNIPEWIVASFKKSYGDLWKDLAQALERSALTDLRVNTLKSNRDDVLKALREAGISADPTPLAPYGIRLNRRTPFQSNPLYQKGLIEIQDEGSQLIALLTDAKPGMAVVDYCAGAGGKTLAIAASMANKGTLFALDTASWRLNRASERLRRAGATIVQRRALDEAATLKWLKRQEGRFDRVLIDAPCSGTGTWRRNPDAKMKLKPTDIEELVVLQREIMDKAASLVKTGGRLIYATCSLLSEENQEQVEAFLKHHPQFKLIPIHEAWIWGPCPVTTQTLQLTPHEHGTDGFFVSIFERF